LSRKVPRQTIRHNAKAAPNGKLAYTLEHEMLCLALPSKDDPDFGHIIQKAREKDSVSSGCAEDHFVVFHKYEFTQAGYHCIQER
jgi:hypothetical protein